MLISATILVPATASAADVQASLSSSLGTAALASTQLGISVVSAPSIAFAEDASSARLMGSDIDGEATNDESGAAVSLSSVGTRVAVGAPLNDGAGSDAGHTRVFDFDGFGWVQMGTDIDGGAAGEHSGEAVALSSDGLRVAVGAPGNTTFDNGTDAGRVRVYAWSGGFGDGGVGVWVQMGSDIKGEAAGDSSGNAVALSADGSILAVGASWNDGNGSNSGHVRVYEWSGSAWLQMGEDIDGEAAGDASGFKAVSLNAEGTRLAVGARYNSDGGHHAGHTRVWEWTRGVEWPSGREWSCWLQMGADIDGEAAGEQSGSAVALSADGARLAVGAPHNDGACIAPPYPKAG